MWERFSRSVFDRIDLVVLVIGLLISFGSWQYFVAKDNTNSQLLNDKGRELEYGLNNFSENLFIFITGVKGLYQSSGEVTGEELSTYISTVSDNSGIENLLIVRYVERVPNKEIANITKKIQSDLPNFVFKADLNYPEQYIVTQIVDAKGKVFDSLGLNLVNDEKRRLAIQEAITTQGTVITAVKNIVDVEEYNGSGLIFIVPVLKNGEVVGFINALVKVDKVIENIKGILGENIHLLNWYGGDLIYEGASPKQKLLTKELKLKITNGTNWTLKIGSAAKINQNLNLLLGIGIVISFLLYVMVYGLASAGVRGEEIAKTLTSKLNKYKLALDAASNHIVITDINGIVIYANISAQKLTGFDLSEIIGKTPRLWGGQMAKDFYVDFWKQIKTDKKVFSGDFNNRRKNGENYIAEATVSPIIDEKGVLVGFVGVEIDVTEEKKLYKQNSETLDKLNKFNQLMVGRETKMMELKKELSDLKLKSDQ